MTTARPIDFTCILDYFDRSPFAYLALDAGDQSLRLERAVAKAALDLTAPAIGTVVAIPPGGALPKVGDRVLRGQALFALRRFSSVVEIQAPCDGDIGSVDVTPEQFVEFGQALARVVPD